MNPIDHADLVRTVVERVVGEVSTKKMTLDLALRLTEAVKKKASEMGVKAVVAVSDASARLISMQCMDDSFIASKDIAAGKAYTSVALKMSTKELSALAAPGGSLYGIQFTNDGNIVIFGGGEVLRKKDGTILGGLGVSGGTEEQDTALAAFGAEQFSHMIF